MTITLENWEVRIAEEWLVRFVPNGDHWLDFHGWARIGVQADGAWLFGAMCADRTIGSDPAAHPRDVEGFVKWDGCSEWYWPTDDWHLCGPHDLEQRIALFRAVYEEAEKFFARRPMPVDFHCDWTDKVAP